MDPSIKKIGKYSAYLAVGVCIAVGVIMLIIAFVINHFGEKNSKLCTEPVTAVVSDIVSKVDSDGDTLYAPEFTYEAEGKTYKTHTNAYSSPMPYGIGEKVELLYEPDSPSHFIIKEEKLPFYKLMVYIFGGVGLLFTVFPLFLLIIMKLALRHEEKKREQSDYEL